MTLINHEQVAGHYVEAEAHVKGMKKIVDLRGGLNKIEDGAVAGKICRTDILFTLQQGDHPLFYRDKIDGMQKSLLSRGFTLQSVETSHFRTNEPVLKKAFSDLMGVCDLFNNHIDKKPLDLIEFQEILISICYRLLQFRTLNRSRLIGDADSAHHIGLLVFMMSMFWNNHQNRLAKPGLIAACIKEALEMADDLENEFVFWMLVLGGISVSGNEDIEWIVVRLHEKARQLGVVTWDDARDLLHKFPWMTVIHDTSGQTLWNKVRSLDMELNHGVTTEG
jgi:hypothetical protein